MAFFSNAAFLSLTLLLGSARVKAADCPSSWSCPLVETAPTLDADFSEWADIPSFTTSLVSQVGSEYVGGKVELKCAHDATNVYFSLQIPGEYRFNSTDDKQCAAIGTMVKVGSLATFKDMGGCPDAAAGCDAPPETCTDYRVDLGAHWELKTTEQGVLYGMTADSGTGNDPIANNDDEYAVHSECRFDDDGESAGNEWSGAWAHTNPVDGEMGDYLFEISRTLSTQSSVTDAQFVSGQTFSFGVAYWDPFQLESGWTASGHYLTGCGTSWVDLTLSNGEETPTPAPAPTTSDAAKLQAAAWWVFFLSSFLV